MFLHSGCWVLSEIIPDKINTQTYSVDMLVNGMRSLLIPEFLISSDDVNREVVLAGFAFLINFSLVFTVSIIP